MAGDGVLDDEALIDLAEVRWRTGDLPGAGRGGRRLPGGRPRDDARPRDRGRGPGRARPPERGAPARRPGDPRADRSLDGVFAGLPRSSIWPRDVRRRGHGPARGARARRRPPDGADPPRAGCGDAARRVPRLPLLPRPGMSPMAPGVAGRRGGDRRQRSVSAAIQLALALRASPALAPAVLDLARDQTGPAFDVIRGDAFRIVGREGEARRSFAAAATTARTPMEPPRRDRPNHRHRPHRATQNRLTSWRDRDRTHTRPHQARWRPAPAGRTHPRALRIAWPQAHRAQARPRVTGCWPSATTTSTARGRSSAASSTSSRRRRSSRWPSRGRTRSRSSGRSTGRPARTRRHRARSGATSRSRRPRTSSMRPTAPRRRPWSSRCGSSPPSCSAYDRDIDRWALAPEE